MAARRLIPWVLLLGAALAMAVRAPIYLSEPSFWAEEGSLFFAVAWEQAPWAALTYRPTEYLVWWANLATTATATLVHLGAVPLARAPLVTVCFALAAQLLPVAVIAWSRAPFWGGPLRRVVAIAIVLLGVLTDEIWLNTVNSQHWLVLAAALLALEPPAGKRTARIARAVVLGVAAVCAPVTAALVPLFAWRAWRTRSRAAWVDALVVMLGGLVQLFCLWQTMRGSGTLAARGQGADIGSFAALVWLRALVVPLAGVSAAQWLGQLAGGTVSIGPLPGMVLLLGAAALIALLAQGLRAEERWVLVGAWASITAVTFLGALGDRRMLMRSPWSSSRYGFATGVLVLLMVLGGTRAEAGRVRAFFGAVVLGAALIRGAVLYPSAVRWQPGWPRWPSEVAAWQIDASRPLRIWPPPWTVTLRR